MSKEDRIKIPIDTETWKVLTTYAKELNISTDDVAHIAILSFAKDISPDLYAELRAETDPKIIELVERKPSIL